MTSAARVPPEKSSRTSALELGLVVVAAGALLSAVTNVAPLEWRTPDTEIVLDGVHYRAGPEEIGWLESFTARHFDAGEEAARALVVAEIDAKLDALFEGAEAQLPEFLDWYYSLGGEYSRIAMAALEAADLREPGFVAERASAMLFPDEVWTAHLTALEADAAARLGAHYDAVRAAWQEGVAHRLSAQRVPAPLDTRPERPMLVLDEFVDQVVAREVDALGTRVSIGAAAAGVGAVAAPALGRAAAARGGRALATRAAARGASRVGAAAASGAAVCAVGGPAAAACAALAAAGTWLVTDWALLRVDERLHRQELERSLDEALGRLRTEIESELVAAFDASLAAHSRAIEGEIGRTFVPAHAGSAGQGEAAAPAEEGRAL